MKRLFFTLLLAVATPCFAHDDPGVHAIHFALVNVVAPDAAMTDQAVQDGPWSDGSTWQDGTVPTSGDKVLVPLGVSVTYEADGQCAWLKLKGRLIWSNETGPPPTPFDREAAIANLVAVADRFGVNQATPNELIAAALGLIPPPPPPPVGVTPTLRCETIVVDTTGELIVGTPEQPASGEIVFTNPGPLAAADWTQVGRGLLVLGKCSLWGEGKTPWTRVAVNPRGGDATLKLEAPPTNWRVGDKLVIPGVMPPKRFTMSSDVGSDEIFGQQHETRTIAAIDGSEVALDAPLTHDLHDQLKSGRKLAIGNLTRSLTLRSESKDRLRRGHVMFMPAGVQDYQIGYTAFVDLGRTTSAQHVTDPQKDLAGAIIEMADALGRLVRSDANARGRYSLHFHKMGYDSHALVKGCAFDGALKWAMSNHGSRVDCEDCVAFDCDGSSFNTENGVELGAFRRCLAVKAMGYGRNNANFFRDGRYVAEDGQDVQGINFTIPGSSPPTPYPALRNSDWQKRIAPAGNDTGFAGYGFWLEGNSVDVIDCESYGAMWESFAWVAASLEKDAAGLPLKIPASVIDPALASAINPNATAFHPGELPFRASNVLGVGAGFAGLGFYHKVTCKLPHEIIGGFVDNCPMGIFNYSNADAHLIDGVTFALHPAAIKSFPPASTRYYGFDTYQFSFKTELRNCKFLNYHTPIHLPQGGITITSDETRLEGVVNILMRPSGHTANNTFLMDFPATAFGRIEDAALQAMYPTTWQTQTTWNVGLTGTSSAGVYLLKHGDKSWRLWFPSQAPADAVDLPGVQAKATEVAP